MKTVKKMDAIPEEIIVKILSYLSPYRDFSSARLVSRKWNRAIRTIAETGQREFRQAIINGSLCYAKLDFAAGPKSGQRRERLPSGFRSQRHNLLGNTQQPGPRFSHNACAIDRFLYVFGGCSLSNSTSNSTFNDLHQFDLVDRKWQRITVNQGYMPTPRECSSMAAYDGKLVIFGGWCSPRSTEVTGIPKFFNDTSIIDIQNRSCLAVKNLDGGIPSPRAGHSACILGEKMIVFGGAQRILRYDDIWFLDMISLQWYSPCIKGKKPEGRFGHSQVGILNVLKSRIEKMKTGTSLLAKRSKLEEAMDLNIVTEYPIVEALLLQAQSIGKLLCKLKFSIGENHVLIIGGCGGTNTLFDDAWLLNTVTWQWTEINIENKLWQPPDMWCHPLVKVSDLLVTFSDQTVCNTCIGWQGNPLENSLFAGPVPIPSVTCNQCKQNKVKKQNYDSHFQMYVLDIENLLKNESASWTFKPSFIPQNISRSRLLFTLSQGKCELLIFGGVFNMEKLKIASSHPPGLILVKAN